MGAEAVGAEATRAVRRAYDRSASRYDRSIAIVERLFLGDGRAETAGAAGGRVLEIAVGTGRNLPHYPPETTVTGVDLSGAMLEHARRSSEAVADRSLHLVVADAEVLPFPDGVFDTVVCTLGLCTVPDDRRAVDEASRVLRPGGRLLLLEHVRSTSRLVRAVQRTLEPVALRLAHDHLLRQPLDAVSAAGFVVEGVHRTKRGVVERVEATKPALVTP